MRGKLLNFAAALSLILFTATVALWARSYWHVDIVGREGWETGDHWQRGGHASSGRGLIAVEWWLRQNAPSKSRSQSQFGWGYTTWPLGSIPTARPWHGFTYQAVSWDSSMPTSGGRSVPKRMTYSHKLTAPHSALMIATGLPIALGLRSILRRRRVEGRLRRNLCAACGYDLRGTPDRCPECGTTTASAK